MWSLPRVCVHPSLIVLASLTINLFLPRPLACPLLPIPTADVTAHHVVEASQLAVPAEKWDNTVVWLLQVGAGVGARLGCGCCRSGCGCSSGAYRTLLVHHHCSR